MREDLFPNGTALEAAQRRLERAVATLTSRLRETRAANPSAAEIADSARLRSELAAAQAREQQLEQVAAEASAALGRAAAEVRAALAAEA